MNSKTIELFLSSMVLDRLYWWHEISITMKIKKMKNLEQVHNNFLCNIVVKTISEQWKRFKKYEKKIFIGKKNRKGETFWEKKILKLFALKDSKNYLWKDMNIFEYLFEHNSLRANKCENILHYFFNMLLARRTCLRNSHSMISLNANDFNIVFDMHALTDTTGILQSFFESSTSTGTSFITGFS